MSVVYPDFQKDNFRKIASEAKFYESYSRFLEEENRYETWEESVNRVMNMHREFYADKMTPELSKLIDRAEEGYAQKLFLGSQRALQYGGDQLLRNHMKLYNCLGGYCDRPEFFGEVFWLLLCGCGAGFSVQKHHVANLPKVKERHKNAKTFTIPDSIEGWAQALDVLMSSFFEDGGKHPEFEGRRVYFDTTEIREKNAYISGGFKAPGPEPLRVALDKIERILTKVAKENRQLKPVEAYDITMHAADAVIAGGVRRSATICLFSIDDEEMMNAKTGQWYIDNPQRARSNNSAVCVRGEITYEQFKHLYEKTKQFGEPGFYFTESTEHVTNPCVTDDTIVMTDDGPKEVKDLIEKPFNAMVDGKSYKSSGFYKTGDKPVYKVKTKSGYNLKATGNHKILTERGWVEVYDLKNDDKIVLDNSSDVNIDIDENEKSLGWLLGEVVGDGGYNPDKYSSYVRFWGPNRQNLHNKAYNIISENLKTYNHKEEKSGDILTIESVKLDDIASDLISPKDKNIYPSLEKMNSSFVAGFLQGYFDADGSVQGNQEKGYSVRLASNNILNLESVQRMLARFGIISKICKSRKKAGYYDLPNGKGGNNQYYCKEMNELIISKRNMKLFEKYIGFVDPDKNEKLNNIIENISFYKETFLSGLDSVSICGFEPVYDCYVEDVHRFNANGIVIHNCCEIGFYAYYGKNTGWSACNLSEINGGMCYTEEIFYKACELASIVGTLQAGYTDFKFVSDITKKIIDREALLGVSITGWANNPDILLNERVLRNGAKIVKETNEKVANLIGINAAARATCTKPSGNASVLLGTASGIHNEHSEMYIRHIQMNKDQEVAKLIRDTNPYMVENSVWSANGTDYVIAFPIIPPKGSIYRRESMNTEFLERVKLAQNSWVEEGTCEERCVDPRVRHNISNTTTVTDGKWDEVGDYIFENREYFSGISLLGEIGDKDFNQAPNTEVKTASKILDEYGESSMFASGLIVDALSAFGDLWVAIDHINFGIEPDENDDKRVLKEDWIRRFRKFSEQYHDDLKTTEYLLKDVHLLHKWNKIVNNYQPIDWINNLDQKEYTDINTLAAIACHGGACDIL